MAKPLTIKEKKYVKHYVKSGNGTQAVLDSYNTKDPETASIMSVQIQKKTHIKEAIEESLERAGLNDDTFASELSLIALKGAEKPLSYADKLKALETYGRIKGHLGNKAVSKLTVSLSEKLEATSFQEVKRMLGTSRERTTRLLEDLE